MEKVINIEGRDVKFCATAALALRYKSQFGRDLYRDMAKVQKCWNGPAVILSEEEIKTGVLTPEHEQALASVTISDELDLDLIYNIIWVMAKGADRTIPPPVEWYDTFENGFPLFGVFGELSDMLMRSMNGTLKN